MPQTVVDVNLQSQTGAIARRTYSDLVIVGNEPDVADPDYNDPKVYDSASSVSGDFGSGSDVYTASQEVEGLGVNQWWVVMLDNTAYSEVVGNSDAESTDSGTVSNTPMRGDLQYTTASVDGTSKEIVPATGTPPSKPDTSQVAINFDTGEVKSGESSSGTGAGIEISYETLSWDSAFPDMTANDLDLAVLADTRADRSYIGEVDELLAWCEKPENEASIVLAYENGSNYASDTDAMNAAHDFGAYLPSGKILPIAHKSPDDVSAGVAGRLATKQPWFNPYMDGSADYTFSLDEYRRSLMGGPEQPGTFEGGNSSGNGPTNVLHTEMGVQILSNSVSTAGEASNYQFFDVARTETFIVNEARNALRSLALRRETVPFVPKGRTLIENALRKTLNPYVASTGRALSQEEIRQLRQAASSDGSDTTVIPETRATNDETNVPLSQLDINVPAYDDLSQQARANRQWTDIQITAQLAGSAHTFAVDLAVSV